MLFIPKADCKNPTTQTTTVIENNQALCSKNETWMYIPVIGSIPPFGVVAYKIPKTIKNKVENR